jgi:Outer membrane protein LpxR
MRAWNSLLVWLAASCLLASRVSAQPHAADGQAPQELGWTLHLDNDLFAFSEDDRDYTGGVAFTLGGERATQHPLFLGGALDWANRATRFQSLLERGTSAGDALEIGLLLFTPQDISSEMPVLDDRPYANLLYLASTTLAHDAARGVAYQSSLTLGVVGLPVAEGVHRGLHELLGGVEPQGYAHQISDGGEPTARFALSRYQLLARGAPGNYPYTVRLGLEGSVGYVTEANAEIALRAGKTRLPWWSSLPTSSGFTGHPPVGALDDVGRAERIEVVFEVGAKARARIYNAFLQGQFRDSDVQYSASELRHWLVESWLGVTALLKNDVAISYAIRHQTEEIKNGHGSRGFTWASLDIARRF